jgi:hypothetical protein
VDKKLNRRLPTGQSQGGSGSDHRGPTAHCDMLQRDACRPTELLQLLSSQTGTALTETGSAAIVSVAEGPRDALSLCQGREKLTHNSSHPFTDRCGTLCMP